MSWGWSSARGRLLSRAGIGVLSWVIPPGLADEAVGDGLAWEMRLRALPARLGVYFVPGCALLPAGPYGEVIRRVVAGLERALAAAGWQVPASTALTGVRPRLGEAALGPGHRGAGAGPAAAAQPAAGDAAAGRPELLRLPAAERRRGHRRGPAVAGQGQPAPARRPRAARRVLPGARQRPRRGAGPDPPQRRPPPPPQQARPPDPAAARPHPPGPRVPAHRHPRPRP